MTKSEKIQEAYGSNWEQIKPFVDADGWYVWDENCPVNLVISGFQYNKKLDAHRPESLSGIEDNNGWINIESEADLPTEPGYYFTKMKLNPEKTRMTKFPVTGLKTDGNLWLENVIAYQKVIFPKDKIY
jgi:hypothetical protein